jgi:hypothetical protein
VGVITGVGNGVGVRVGGNHTIVGVIVAVGVGVFGAGKLMVDGVGEHAYSKMAIRQRDNLVFM